VSHPGRSNEPISEIDFSGIAAGSLGGPVRAVPQRPVFIAGLSVLSGFATLHLSSLVGDPMNKFLVGFIAGVFVGVLLAPVFSPEVIVLAAIILLVLAIVLMYLFYRGVLDFQDFERP
jgi:hypothetical protein